MFPWRAIYKYIMLTYISRTLHFVYTNIEHNQLIVSTEM